MSKLGEIYAPRYLSGDLTLGFIVRKLKSVQQKKQFCAWFIDRMIYSDVRAGQSWPPVEEPAQELYSAVRALIEHTYLTSHSAKLILSECESFPETSDGLLRRLCADSPGIVIRLIAHIDVPSSPCSELALGRLLDAEGHSVWLDAAKTTKTKKELYLFTKWRDALDQIPRSARGQILEEELGL